MRQHTTHAKHTRAANSILTPAGAKRRASRKSDTALIDHTSASLGHTCQMVAAKDKALQNSKLAKRRRDRTCTQSKRDPRDIGAVRSLDLIPVYPWLVQHDPSLLFIRFA